MGQVEAVDPLAVDHRVPCRPGMGYLMQDTGVEAGAVRECLVVARTGVALGGWRCLPTPQRRNRLWRKSCLSGPPPACLPGGEDLGGWEFPPAVDDPSVPAYRPGVPARCPADVVDNRAA